MGWSGAGLRRRGLARPEGRRRIPGVQTRCEWSGIGSADLRLPEWDSS